MSIGYFESSAVVSLLAPGRRGDVAAEVWKSLDVVCASKWMEIEVASGHGRQLDRMVWVWTVEALNLVDWTPEMHEIAIELAWLGAPVSVATHVACATVVTADHFVTSSAVAHDWAELRGLNVVRL